MRHNQINKESFQVEMARKFRTNKGKLAVKEEIRVEVAEKCNCCGHG